ncbi:acyl-CoA thioesterase [Pseudoduganella sp. S-14]|uniref:acyl-CoA thioesterase n=1 Tax=Pseudoduganella sp. S-14 TaxID=3404065 RepID=UPI003CEAE327
MTLPHWDRPAPFILPVTPQTSDIDGLDHTNNAVYVRWCEQAGWAHSHALGLTLADYKRLDRGMAIRRSEFDYIFATNEGEQLLLGTWLLPGDSPLSMQRCFQLLRQRDNSTVLRARWDLVCIELSSGRPKRLPPEFSAVYLPAFSACQPT